MITYQEYKVVSKKWEVKDTFILKITPIASNIKNFTPGQYIVMKNPTYKNKNEEHIFSIASSPNQDYLEFCIKVFGNWTKYLSKAVKGDKILISNSSGIFTWDDSIQNAVFLIGGIGVSPIMSMLRYISESKIKPNLTLIYGAPNSDLVPYKKELEELEKKHSLKIVYVYSALENQTTTGYSGLITKEIIAKEIDFKKQKPVIFYCGSNSFMSYIKPIIQQFKIPQKNIRSEARE